MSNSTSFTESSPASCAFNNALFTHCQARQQLLEHVALEFNSVLGLRASISQHGLAHKSMQKGAAFSKLHGTRTVCIIPRIETLAHLHGMYWQYHVAEEASHA